MLYTKPLRVIRVMQGLVHQLQVLMSLCHLYKPFTQKIHVLKLLSL